MLRTTSSSARCNSSARAGRMTRGIDATSMTESGLNRADGCGEAKPFAVRQMMLAKCRYGSSTAAPVAGARGNYGSDNGHEGGRLGWLSHDEAKPSGCRYYPLCLSAVSRQIQSR